MRAATFAPYRVVPIGQSLPYEIWTRSDLVTAGYTPAASCVSVFGVIRWITDVVWHDTEGDSIEGAVATWDAGNASATLSIGNGQNGDVDGEIVLTCRLEDVAWHAGTDASTGRTPFWQTHNINPRSIGVELVGHYLKGYTVAQLLSANRIAHWAEQYFDVPRIHVQDRLGGHHAHSELSNQRSDPGDFFDWEYVLGS